MQDKVAIITGAGQGIGYEIAKKLALGGHKVILNDIDDHLAAGAAEAINKINGICSAVAGDASEPEIIRRMVDTAIEKYGQLDIVVANAGITLFGDFFTYTRDSFYKVLQVNLGGVFFLAQAASVQMAKQQSGGSLLFISSVTAHQAHKNLAVYGMSKAAIEMLAKTLVIDLSPHKINVNTIAPGATLTERTSTESDYAEVWARITPMGRPAYTQDIAEAALFLVSEKARHITGQTLIINGGWTSVSPSPYD